MNIIKQNLVLSDSVHDLGDLDSVNVSLGKVGLEDSTFPVRKDIRSHSFPIVGKTINEFPPNSRQGQVCADVEKAKNLTKVAPHIQENGAGAKQQPTIAYMRAELVDYSWFLKKEGYRESTIISRTRRLRRLIKLGANLHDIESVKEVISKQATWSLGFKEAVVDAYSSFLRMRGIAWNPPRYVRTRRLPFIPVEAEIDQLIAGCGKKTAAFLQTLKETAMRPGEAVQLRWTDLDSVSHSLRLNEPEKGSNPRVWRIPTKLVKMLNNMPKTSTRIFGDSSLRTKRCNYEDQRRRIAGKLQNPRLLQIKFQTFRHWKATMEYHRTKDILYVMKFLGHRNIKNTLVYTQLLPEEDDEYVVKVARTLKDAKTLLECGFEYVTDMNNHKLFRKRK